MEATATKTIIDTADDPLHEAALRIAEEIEKIVGHEPFAYNLPAQVDRLPGFHRALAIINQVQGEVRRGNLTRGAS